MTSLAGPKPAEAHSAQVSYTVGQCQSYWEAGPQISAHAVIQKDRLDNSIKSEPVTRFILGLVEFFPKKVTFKLSLTVWPEPI